MKAALLLRILACVALVVAGVPLWASVCRPSTRKISAPIVTPMATCAMPCCAAKSAPVSAPAACCPGEVPAESRSIATAGSGSCSLSVVVAPATGVVAAIPVGPTFSDVEIARTPAIAILVEPPVEPIVLGGAGIVGTDPGPPPSPPDRPTSGLSPPVRA